VQPGKAPSDAIVLFDGLDLSHWVSAKDGGEPKWEINDRVMQIVPGTGDLRTKDTFGDCQLHVEWAAPSEVKGNSQGRGNSGIFMMGLIEIQVLDSYNNLTYADGHAASVYGVQPPLVNALHPPGEFQVYDIVFRRPIYKEGKLADSGYVTVFVNGVLAQDHTQLEGINNHMVRSKPSPFPEKGPLRLQDHGNPMRFRNIWYRELPPRAIEGGTDGPLTAEATLAKRKAIAANIREQAEQLKNQSHAAAGMLRLMESLEYEKDEPTLHEVGQMARDYVRALRDLPAEKIAARKDEAKGLSNAFNYLAKFNLLPPDFEPKKELESLIKDFQWDKK
jgi:hypothetical protein